MTRTLVHEDSEYKRKIRGKACKSCIHCERNAFTDWGVCLMLSELRRDHVVFVHVEDDTPGMMDCLDYGERHEEDDDVEPE